MEKQYPELKLTLVCDDIRFELYEKQSLIGVYPNDVIVSESVPLVLPMLCFYQQWVKAQGDFDVALKLIDPENKELFSGEKKTVSSRPSGVLNFGVQLSNMRLEREGVYKLLTFFDDLERPRSVFEFQLKKGEVKPL